MDDFSELDKEDGSKRDKVIKMREHEGVHSRNGDLRKGVATKCGVRSGGILLDREV